VHKKDAPRHISNRVEIYLINSYLGVCLPTLYTYFYWDNWRQGYYYRNGAVWIFNTTPPPVIINVNLDKEPNYELKEGDDDVDDVYQINDNHLKEFKSDSIK
jgi:hypothetical protein